MRLLSCRVHGAMPAFFSVNGRGRNAHAHVRVIINSVFLTVRLITSAQLVHIFEISSLRSDIGCARRIRKWFSFIAICVTGRLSLLTGVCDVPSHTMVSSGSAHNLHIINGSPGQFIGHPHRTVHPNVLNNLIPCYPLTPDRR